MNGFLINLQISPIVDIDLPRTVNWLPRFGRIAQQIIRPPVTDRKTQQHVESRIKFSGLRCSIYKRYDIYQNLDLLVKLCKKFELQKNDEYIESARCRVRPTE